MFLLLLPILAVSFLSGLEAVVPSRCFEKVRCVDATVLVVEHDVTLARCANLCAKDYEGLCKYYVHDSESNLCSVYADCREASSCESCVFGTNACVLTECFANGFTCDTEEDEGSGDNNNDFLLMEDVSDLEECRQLCEDEQDNLCSYYEYREMEKIEKFDEDNNNNNNKCLLLSGCTEPRPEKGVMVSPNFCEAQQFNCFQPYRCEGHELLSQLSTATACFELCKENDECQWAEHFDGVCSLLSDCTRRLQCPECILAQRDCITSGPSHFLAPTSEGLEFRLLSTFERPLAQPNQTLIPMNTASIITACLTKNRNLALLCTDERCYHYDVIQDKWAQWSTYLSQKLAANNAKCTALEGNEVLITGVGGTGAYIIEVDVEQPEHQAKADEDVLDARTGHCITQLSDNQFFLAGGRLKNGTPSDPAVILTDFDGNSETISQLNLLKGYINHVCGLRMATETRNERVVLAGSTVKQQSLESLIINVGSGWGYVEGPDFPNPLINIEKVQNTDEADFIIAGENVEQNLWQVLKFSEDQGWILLHESSYDVGGIKFGLAVALVE